MRLKTAALLASVLLAPGAGSAQVLPGNEITVNPVAGSGRTLLYPGGQYTRIVRPLLQPGQTVRNTNTINLHMPRKQVARRAPAVRDQPAVAAAPAPRRVAAAAPPPAPTSSGAYYGGFGGAANLGLNTEIARPAAPQAPPPATPRRQVARAAPPPASTAALANEAPMPGLTKRSVILFAAGASDPAQSALGAIKFLAGDLNASMTTASSRIQILAYGGAKGDKGSDARRLSLKRALAIRQVLIDDGVPAERIDVRAMGGVDDTGPADRVDVYVKA